MNLIRKYKISKLLNKPINKKDAEIINFIKTSLTNLSVFTEDKSGHSIYYFNKNAEFVLEYYFSAPKMLWINHNSIFKILTTKYFMTHNDIINILQFFLKELLNINIETYKIGTMIPPSDDIIKRLIYKLK